MMSTNPPIPWSDEERDTLRRLRENGVERQAVRRDARPLVPQRAAGDTPLALPRKTPPDATTGAPRATAARGAGVAAAAAIAEA